MRIVKTVGAFLAIMAVAALFSGSVFADTLPGPGEKTGQPIITGDLHSEPQHGVIHCHKAGELLLGATGGESAGVIVVNPNGPHLAAPEGGDCEAFYNSLF